MHKKKKSFNNCGIRQRKYKCDWYQMDILVINGINWICYVMKYLIYIMVYKTFQMEMILIYIFMLNKGIKKNVLTWNWH